MFQVLSYNEDLQKNIGLVLYVHSIANEILKKMNHKFLNRKGRSKFRLRECPS